MQEHELHGRKEAERQIPPGPYPQNPERGAVVNALASGRVFGDDREVMPEPGLSRGQLVRPRAKPLPRRGKGRRYPAYPQFILQRISIALIHCMPCYLFSATTQYMVETYWQ